MSKALAHLGKKRGVTLATFEVNVADSGSPQYRPVYFSDKKKADEEARINSHRLKPTHHCELKECWKTEAGAFYAPDGKGGFKEVLVDVAV